MPSEKRRCAVIGAANIDIGGFPIGVCAMGDSNPGRIRLSAGGVGRNIACNLSRLGVETHLVTALGGDAFADILRSDCASAGVHLEHALICPDAASSAYLFVADAAGDMALAVNDMSICAMLTPSALEPLTDWLNGMDAVVLDANLPGDTLEYIAEQVRVPLIADAVSAAKVIRLAPILPRLWALKPNALETAALTGLPADLNPAAAARGLRALGLKRAFITLGPGGVCAMDGEAIEILPCPAARLVNATGAGDAFTAALAWALLNGLDTPAAARAGLAASAIALECEATVSPAMSEAALKDRMNHLAGSADAL